MKEVAIFNKEGNFLGNLSKNEALTQEAIRGAVRVFVFNDIGKLFLQKRDKNMNIAPGKWDQSCSGHIDEGEEPEEAAKRELEEELGVSGVPLEFVCGRYFEETYDGKLFKSYDFIYRCRYDGEIKVQKSEIEVGRWVKREDLEKEIKEHPENFTETLSRIDEISDLF
ncbi:hypothetical protein A2914_01295 [Candidatus Nomurabacteria bacterium RIFCSPLOWO2_01_FULL_41_21]|uniref:Nudix hydrolase domain-containing protein n=2 Tax=Candidatus Nomuraibacteriota TaxID=1752729 RepID=A0A1F6X1N0_9BACT|nr:MAG: hypothetical protein A2647_03845 [Candidatus Nomurabacteria bacterium RIFCSPHIGHO2_01_FULL_40_24b]OGI87945.1 MAG: hypothetical protein A2914_01295 [Candidatus Nomurabacteria bacterium RIFCSPLOWO2_01_FULL_41_21]